MVIIGAGFRLCPYLVFYVSRVDNKRLTESTD